MTGFGVADGVVGGGRLAVEVRTVNHRHFHAQLRLPAALQALEGELRDHLRRAIARGHVALAGRWTEEPQQTARIGTNLDRAREILAALRELQATLDVPGDVDLAFLARQPDVLQVGADAPVEIDRAAVLSVVDAAVREVLAMREREGEVLTADLRERLGCLETSLARVTERAPARLHAERERLRAAVRELLDGAAVDEVRLSQELAFLAEKLDIAEEIVRLGAHLAACGAALEAEEPAGRRLAFLAQEMLREINTIGSKAGDAQIAEHVIDMKTELEKFREQVENVE